MIGCLNWLRIWFAVAPIQQSVKVDLILNMRTAKALGLAIPIPLLGRVDEVMD